MTISKPKMANFPVFSRVTGNRRAETSSLMTASSAKIVHAGPKDKRIRDALAIDARENTAIGIGSLV